MNMFVYSGHFMVKMKKSVLPEQISKMVLLKRHLNIIHAFNANSKRVMSSGTFMKPIRM